MHGDSVRAEAAVFVPRQRCLRRGSGDEKVARRETSGSRHHFAMRAGGAHRGSSRTFSAQILSTDARPEVSPLATFDARFQRAAQAIRAAATAPWRNAIDAAAAAPVAQRCLRRGNGVSGTTLLTPRQRQREGSQT
ncbi:MAG TPA: hypothetical protein VIW64_04145 [Pyrinomonadaceae bacterium]